jgi:hypothetical protein
VGRIGRPDAASPGRPRLMGRRLERLAELEARLEALERQLREIA